MLRKLLLGIALAAVTSCTPAPAPRRAVAYADIPAARARSLLQQLALHAPADLSAAPPSVDGIIPAAAPPFLDAATTPDDARRAGDCLTAAIYYEARSEPVDGQRAVAQVVLNRVRDRAFPRSVCGVVYQRSSKGCQFSFVCDGSMNRATEPGAWDRARAVAEAALGGDVYAPVGSATFYHANYVNPWWASSLDAVARVGTHLFYRWRGALAGALTFRQQYAGVEPGAPVGDANSPVSASYASATESGVAVHRGNDMASAATPAPVATPAVAAGGLHISVPAALRASVSGGVRVHHGLAPGVEDEPSDEPASSDPT